MFLLDKIHKRCQIVSPWPVVHVCNCAVLYIAIFPVNVFNLKLTHLPIPLTHSSPEYLIYVYNVLLSWFSLCGRVTNVLILGPIEKKGIHNFFSSYWLADSKLFFIFFFSTVHTKRDHEQSIIKGINWVSRVQILKRWFSHCYVSFFNVIFKLGLEITKEICFSEGLVAQNLLVRRSSCLSGFIGYRSTELPVDFTELVLGTSAF